MITQSSSKWLVCLTHVEDGAIGLGVAQKDGK